MTLSKREKRKGKKEEKKIHIPVALVVTLRSQDVEFEGTSQYRT